jgi:hypothetical protein
MRHSSVRPFSKLASRLLVSSILTLGLACGSSDGEAKDPEPSSSNGGTSATPPASTAPAANGGAPPGMPSAEDIAALTDAFGMAAGQIQAACGPSFDRCGATPGCNEILTCAAQNACSGADCYCLGEGCATDGPCRSVIDSASGARVPDATDQSLGPASDAARAVGACLQGLGGGMLPTQPPTSPAATSDAGTAQPDAG